MVNVKKSQIKYKISFKNLKTYSIDVYGSVEYHGVEIFTTSL